MTTLTLDKAKTETTTVNTNTPRDSEKRETFKRIPAGLPRMKTPVAGLKKGYRGYYAHPRQFNELIDAGYVFVREETGDYRLGSLGERNPNLGSLVAISATRKDPNEKLYLMAIREDWYNENQKIKQDKIDQTEAQIRRGKFHAPTNSYVPQEGISTSDRHVEENDSD